MAKANSLIASKPSTNGSTHGAGRTLPPFVEEAEGHRFVDGDDAIGLLGYEAFELVSYYAWAYQAIRL